MTPGLVLNISLLKTCSAANTFLKQSWRSFFGAEFAPSYVHSERPIHQFTILVLKASLSGIYIFYNLSSTKIWNLFKILINSLLYHFSSSFFKLYSDTGFSTCSFSLGLLNDLAMKWINASISFGIYPSSIAWLQNSL